VGLTAPPRKNPVVRKSKEGYGPITDCQDEYDDDDDDYFLINKFM
jgi:hypothetical protein